MPRSGLVALACCAFAAACGPGAANPNAPQPAGFRIVADPVVDLTSGESRALAVEPSGSYLWTSSAPGVARVDGAGVVHAGPDLGQSVITATAPDGRTASARVWVQLPASVPSTYRITMSYADDVPVSWRPVFEYAVERWQRVIRAPLPAVDMASLTTFYCPFATGAIRRGSETGTRIIVIRSSIKGSFAGGPCAHRLGDSPTVALGMMEMGQFTNGDPAEPARSLVLHEMGHALGLVGNVLPPYPPWMDHSGQKYSGPLGLEGYRREFGSTVSSIDVAGWHWPWPFTNDIMYRQVVGVGITKASVGALMDLGYPAAWYGAGPF